ncbi:glycoside hydrolase family 20 protein [Streptomyces sp. NBC_01500]|uniref:beta-N-acetylhexosaminidase n=1 Tax=Streptomyces sp. NBC_01500 TaxID=2903886 RepID=UPI00224EDD68|nr:glycoside hydrolase family 20 protein [Streptomyces sp. NBC_01500]MCX4550876.1 family 20 glycosylhydrolase [Streptomyces sp. NBC_01500]
MLSRRSAVTVGMFAGSALLTGATNPAWATGTAAHRSPRSPQPLLSPLSPQSPPTIPAVQHFAPGGTAWRPSPATRLVLSPDDAGALRSEARSLAAELVQEGHVKHPPRITVSSRPGPHDLALRLGPVPGSASPEAYRIDSGRVLVITGRTAAGVFHGTRTLLQVLRQRHETTGSVTDWPEYAQRGLMVDVARKHFTPEWLEAKIRELAWLKLNTLHLHLSDSLGLRIESETHPEVVTSPALSKDQVRHLIAVAERHHVTIVPEIDSPGHLAVLLQAHPELQLVRKDGTRDASNLDYSKPAARELVADLIGEYADLFPGPWFHLGGDEYFGYPWDTNRITGENAPQLLEYARHTAGPNATLQDGFNIYVNGLIALLTRKGKRAKIWNDHVVPGQGVVDIDHSAEVEVWIRWNADEPSVDDYVRAGYDVLNGHGDHLYFILAPDQQHETGKKSAQDLYDVWTPRTFMSSPGADAQLADGAPMSGSHLSIWCDNPDFQTEQQVSESLGPWLRSFAQQIWGSPKPAAVYTEFTPLIDSVGDAPREIPG